MKDLFGQEEIKALSWKQPYGTAMLYDKIETRSWSTKYRGLVLICTTKKGYDQKTIKAISGENQFQRMCIAMNKDSKTINLDGYAIAIGRLVHCRPMTVSDEDKCFVKYKEPWIVSKVNKKGKKVDKEKRIWCHIYEDVKLIKPFQFKGAQGWKKVKKDIMDKIEFI